MNCARAAPGSSPPAPSNSTLCAAAVQPVIDGLAADPDNADLLADIQAIAAEYPDTEVPDVDPECQDADPHPTPNQPRPARLVPLLRPTRSPKGSISPSRQRARS